METEKMREMVRQIEAQEANNPSEMMDAARLLDACLRTIYDMGGITFIEYATGKAWLTVHAEGKCG